MTITIDSIKTSTKTELMLSPTTEETTITLERKSKYTFIHQNDEIVDALPFSYPIMKIVRAIRKAIPNVKMNVI
jgi:hypothetical protein